MEILYTLPFDAGELRLCRYMPAGSKMRDTTSIVRITNHTIQHTLSYLIVGIKENVLVSIDN